MVTIAVMAVLTAIAIPMYTGYISAARNTEGRNNLAAIKLAQEEYYLEYNSYFDGATTALLESNSAGYWTATGTDGNTDADINFTYTVTATTTSYTATATGRGGTFEVPTSVSFSISN